MRRVLRFVFRGLIGVVALVGVLGALFGYFGYSAAPEVPRLSGTLTRGTMTVGGLKRTYRTMIFWGLWLIPLGILVYRSRFLPRFLGVWLIVNGLGYLVNSFTGLLLPQYQNAVGTFTFPALTGEVAFVLWLLIRGAKEQTVNAPAS